MDKLVFEERVPIVYVDQFTKKVREIAVDIGVSPDWIMAAMMFESGLNPLAKNVQNGRLIAMGLIQWTAASGVKGAPSSIANYNMMQQLAMVHEWFKKYRFKLTSPVDLYLTIFFPAAIGKSDDWICQTSGLSAYKIASQNPALDKNPKDGKITKGEIGKSYENFFLKNYPVQHAVIFNQKKNFSSFNFPFFTPWLNNFLAYLFISR